MANVKISELPNATSLSNGDSFPVVQGGVTKQAARSVLFASPTFTGTTTAAILTATGDVTFDGGAFVFNESGADKDARFEGDGDPNLLFLDASADRVGIGTSSPAEQLTVGGTSDRVGLFRSGTTTQLRLGSSAAGEGQMVLQYDRTTGAYQFSEGTNGNTGSPDITVTSSGNVGIGTASPTGQLHLAGANAQQIFRTDQSTSGYTYTQGLDDTGAYFLHNSSARSFRWAPNSVAKMELDASGNLFCQGVYDNTTGSAANVFVSNTGLLQRSTSSLKYKTDVQNASHGLAEVMQLRPVTYKGKTDGDKIFGGLIAEEVDAVGLTEFVQYADDGNPDALAYGNMVSLLIKAVQEQQALITALTARVAALEAG
jgi:hypothetical protein